MEDILKSIQAKLQAFKTLPQPEYRAIGEHLLPQVNECLKNVFVYKSNSMAEQKYTEEDMRKCFQAAKQMEAKSEGGYMGMGNCTAVPSYIYFEDYIKTIK